MFAKAPRLVLAAGILFAAGSASSASTVVPGGDASGTWTRAGSPFVLAGNVRAVDLAIEPGVEVLAGGNFEIAVTGRLRAEGRADAPILFGTVDVEIAWKGLRFENTPDGSSLVHCRIERSDEGAIRIVDSSPFLRNLVISGNRDVSFVDGAGAGIDADLATGDLVLEHCTIEENVSKLDGGGIRARLGSGTLRLFHCTLARNVANPSLIPFDGPGIMFFDAQGGGVTCDGDLEMRGCVVTRNRIVSRKEEGLSLARGAGLFVSRGTATIENCVFAANEAQAEFSGTAGGASALGGGVFSDGASLVARNCVFAANELHSIVTDPRRPAEELGAGLYVNGGSAEIRNATVVSNRPDAVHSSGTTTKISDSIVAGHEISFRGPVEIRYSCVPSPAGPPPGEGNIAADPLLAGPGFTIDDVRLRRVSPCIDAGDPSAVRSDASFPPSRGGPRCDMGALGGPGAAGFFSRAARGGVNGAAGAPAPVLTVNGATLAATVERFSSVEVALAASPAGPDPARFVLWIGRGLSTRETPLVWDGSVAGWLLRPSPLGGALDLRPSAALRSRAPGFEMSDAAIGSAREIVVPGAERAPFSIRFPAFVAPEAAFTIQGMLEDGGAAGGSGFGVTNAVLVQVRD